MKPFGKEPFSWKKDPEYQEEKKLKLEKLHEKILMDELTIPKDKYGNIIKKHIPLNKPLSQDVIDSKKKRYQIIIDDQIKHESQRPTVPNHVIPKIHHQQRKTDLTQKQKQQVSKDRQKQIQKNTKTNTQKRNIRSQKQQKNTQKQSQFHFQRYGGISGPDSNLIESLERQVICSDNGVTMDDIADLQTAKQLLQEAVLLPILLPNFFKGIRRPWKGVLMFGPPGTGKTMLAKEVAATGKMKFFNISASSIASKWKGQSEKLVRLLFEMARFYAPSIIFIDQIDSIASKRSQTDCDATRKVKTELLIQIDGAGSQNQKPVVLIAATNRPWDIDEALRRRLQKRIYIPLPNENGRKQLFVNNTKNIKLDPGIDFNLLSKKTEGFSGADIVILIRSASFLPLRRYLKKAGFNQQNIEQCKKQVDIPLKEKDFMEALSTCNPSVGKQDLWRYEKWMSEYGST